MITDPQISDQIEKIVGFALYRTHACGLKLGLTGTMQDLNRKPGTKETDPKIIRLKLAFLHMHAQLLNLENNFGEASKPIDEALIRRGAPKVKAEDAKKVLSNKSITVLGDGYYYKRFIDSVVGYQEKILLGKPIILP